MSFFLPMHHCTFLSTPSARRATLPTLWRPSPPTYFYPRPLRGGRRPQHCRSLHRTAISIHALCEEGDHQPMHSLNSFVSFLSTPSARRATPRLTDYLRQQGLFLSTPSARRATLRVLDEAGAGRISIHALCEEGDEPDSEGYYTIQ